MRMCHWRAKPSGSAIPASPASSPRRHPDATLQLRVEEAQVGDQVGDEGGVAGIGLVAGEVVELARSGEHEGRDETVGHLELAGSPGDDLPVVPQASLPRTRRGNWWRCWSSPARRTRIWTPPAVVGMRSRPRRTLSQARTKTTIDSFLARSILAMRVSGVMSRARAPAWQTDDACRG
jgi:hypothetical protein